MYNLYSKFNAKLHKKNYVNYLEVVILEDGRIEYAVPSHQEKLIAVACKRLKVSRDELNNLCPVEYYADFLTWLCMQSHAISIWDKFTVYYEVNQAQHDALQYLKDEGLYLGTVPEVTLP